jgi:hypothetical protein
MQTRARLPKPDHNSRVFTCEFNGLIQGSGGRSRVTMMPHAACEPFPAHTARIAERRYIYCTVTGGPVQLPVRL